MPARPPPPYYPLPSMSIPLTPQPPLPQLPNNLGGLPGSLLWILRSGELLELRWQDPEQCQAGHQVSIRASKTDPSRQGVLISLSVSETTLCPVDALDRLRHRVTRHAGSVFVLENRQRVSTRHLHRIFKGLYCHSLSQQLPLTYTPDRYNSHTNNPVSYIWAGPLSYDN